MFSGGLVITLLFISVIILILSSIELYYNKKKSIYTCSLPKDHLVLTPEETGLKHNIVIYNKNKVQKGSFKRDNTYRKMYLEEHIATKLLRPMKDGIISLIHIPTSSTPINNIYNSFKKSDEILSEVNPMNKVNGRFRILVHRDDQITAFISGKDVYIIGSKNKSS